LYHFVVVQIPPVVVVIVVDELLQYQLLMRNFVLRVDRGIKHYLFLNREQGNQNLDLFATAFQCPNDQRLEWRRMYMDLWMMDGTTLGFARMEADSSLTDPVVNNPMTMKLLGFLFNVNTSARERGGVGV
jgi:hypothetical protein